MGTFLHVLSEQYRTEHFFGAERSVLTEHLDPMFPRTLIYSNFQINGASGGTLKLPDPLFLKQNWGLEI